MIRYEHRVAKVTVDRQTSDGDDNDEEFGRQILEEANESGSDGWELVSTNLHVYGNVYEMWLTYKKPLDD